MGDCDHCYDGVIRITSWDDPTREGYDAPCHVCPDGKVLDAMVDALAEDLD